ncbi:hypothetical protein [Chelativorans sp. AA-79]|uniref:hypothetical protein n=1 Tax=Chelativorans sp. AA-79 TaxID=3028735 RepID=UPI0023F8A288|nr:hypothetical protein [Chelativorans sp. AA-79]WEX10091.1 hypothetical protein PVE73_03755 [Chelativorans sp. AA-79]
MISADEDLRARHVLQESALPVAPMAMPEQTLTRRRRGILLRPFFQWLALR